MQKKFQKFLKMQKSSKRCEKCKDVLTVLKRWKRLLQVKSFGNSQREKCKRNESMCQFVYAKALNLPFPLCI